MNLLVKLGIGVIWLIFAGSVVTARPWRGIVPLNSTRADVERILGSPKQSENFRSFYSLANEIVVVHFQATSCDEYGFGWNVSPDTVVEIGVIPKGKHHREEYQLASDAKVDDSGAGFVYYLDDAAGIAVETYGDQVTLVEYYHEAAQENLRCSQKQRPCCIDIRTKFDEYGRQPFADEKARLDNFVINVMRESMRGVIQVRGPSRRQREQQLQRAARSKSYLVKERGIEAERILVIDGGYYSYVVTTLSVHSIGGFASRMYFFPLPEPKGSSPRRAR